ncbi:MAG: NADH-quinone oxidoreductase subunit NuoG [Calditrichaceae bacterium]
MVKIYIDDKEYEVKPEKNLLETILSLGLDLPYFCWHPALGSVGACRQCAVIIYKDKDDKTGKIMMACMESVRDGMRLSLKAPEAGQFRANVIEWLMTNHPHDCPVCDEGGECHLQDMTVMTGHNYRRYRFNKRTYRNQYLGPFINHEMNRCIQCYRCVRFYRDYAGGDDLNVFSAHNHVYFGRHEDGTLENEFSGNLVEVCPTGVFTDKTLKEHYTRKWDLSNAPSICHHCSLGCNIIAGERYGSLRRVLSRYNGAVNGYFICDRGRFGYDFVNNPKRIKQALVKTSDGSKQNISNKNEILKKSSEIIKINKTLIGIGSPRASLESNYMLKKMVGDENFYLGISGREYDLVNETLKILQKGNIRTPSLKETEKFDAVLVLGEDVTNTAPMLALSLRQSIRQQPIQKAVEMKIPEWNDAAVRELNQHDRGPLFIVTGFGTKLDNFATGTMHLNPDEIAGIGFAIANALDGQAPDAGGLSKEHKDFVNDVVQALKKGVDVLRAAANAARALHKNNTETGIFLTVPESNSLGLAMLGGKSVETLNNRKGNEQAAIILENDLYEKLEKSQADEVFQNNTVISLDYIESETTEQADMVLPVGAFAETDGTLVNNEGRAQRFYQSYAPDDIIRGSWRWLKEINASISSEDLDNLKLYDDFVEALIADYGIFKGINKLTPPADFRIAGQKIPRESHRYTGRTAMHAHKNVSEPKPPEDQDSALSFTMEGYRGEPPSSVIPLFWSPGWNSAQSINKFQIEVGGSLHDGDPGLRLIEPDGGADIDYFKPGSANFSKKDGQWVLIPRYHIYGSDALSNLSKSVAKRMPESYLSISDTDAQKIKVDNGDTIHIDDGKQKLALKCRIDNSIAKGTAAISIIPGKVPYLELPVTAKLTGENK